MLAITALFIIVAVASEPVRIFMIEHIWLDYVAMITAIVMLLSLFCCYTVLYKVPMNYIFLFTFTALESYSVATLTCFYQPRYILYAALLTVAMAFSLSLYACFSKTDLTGIGSTLCWVSLGVTIASAILFAVVQNGIVVIIVCWICLILASLYIIVDTQLIAGGRRNQLTVDDYVIGAMMLFIDFIRVFMYILILLGGRRN